MIDDITIIVIFLSVRGADPSPSQISYVSGGQRDHQLNISSNIINRTSII